MDFPYNAYASHTVLGVLYRQSAADANEREAYTVDELPAIRSVIGDFIFFVQPKWRIANDIPGSGNTRNIGGVTRIDQLVNGNGPFAPLGEDVFDDYWMGYFNKVDARSAGIGKPRYHNLETYKKYLKAQARKLKKLE